MEADFASIQDRLRVEIPALRQKVVDGRKATYSARRKRRLFFKSCESKVYPVVVDLAYLCSNNYLVAPPAFAELLDVIWLQTNPAPQPLVAESSLVAHEITETNTNSSQWQAAFDNVVLEAAALRSATAGQPTLHIAESKSNKILRKATLAALRDSICQQVPLPDSLAITIERLLVRDRVPKLDYFRRDILEAAAEVLAANSRSTLSPTTIARVVRIKHGHDPGEVLPGGIRRNTAKHLDAGLRSEAINIEKIRDVDEKIAKMPINERKKYGQTQALRRWNYLKKQHPRGTIKTLRDNIARIVERQLKP